MKIENSIYTGYLWYSNDTKPQIFINEPYPGGDIPEDGNPFIVEGFLFDGQKSMSIKYADGKYHYKVFDVRKEDYPSKDNNMRAKNEVKSFVPSSRITEQEKGKSIKSIDFLQYWREDNGVLEPAEMVFIGFGF